MVRIRSQANCKLVEANCRCLSEVHGWLLWIGRNLDEYMAVREIFAGEPVLFGSEDDRDAAAAVKLGIEKLRRFIETNNLLFRFAVCQRAGANHESAVANRLGERGKLARVLEKVGRADSRARLAPMRFVGRDDGQIGKPEVCHGAGHGTDIQGIARRYEHHVEAFALGFCEQRTIVEKPADKRTRTEGTRRRWSLASWVKVGTRGESRRHLGDGDTHQHVEHGALGAGPDWMRGTPGSAFAADACIQTDIEGNGAVDCFNDLAHGGFASSRKDRKAAGF